MKAVHKPYALLAVSVSLESLDQNCITQTQPSTKTAERRTSDNGSLLNINHLIIQKNNNILKAILISR